MTNCDFPYPEPFVPILLMVSGGSDSTAMMELAAVLARGEEPAGPTGEKLAAMMRAAVPAFAACGCRLQVLHVNHMLRGAASDGDEAFVMRRCSELGVSCHVEHVDIAALAKHRGLGMEAAAREERYRLAQRELDALERQAGAAAGSGLVLTAHTLDDRVETFLMRALVGTGPGGLGSIPHRRGNIVRPLLDAKRQELRDFLIEQHPGGRQEELWREDATNDDGSNFRSRVRTQLVPVMRQLKPGFEHSLARTMDLIAQEDDARSSAAAGIVYRNLDWDGKTAALPVTALSPIDIPLAKRVVRQCLLVVNPDARLESAQIDAIVTSVRAGGRFAVDVESGIRVNSDGELLTMRSLR